MTKMNRKAVSPYQPSRIYTGPSGALVHYQTKNTGYGFSEYQIVGSFDEVSAAVASILRSYPPNPYCTHVNWPPGKLIDWGPHKGEPQEHMAPTDLGNGLWHVDASHSNTSD